MKRSRWSRIYCVPLFLLLPTIILTIISFSQEKSVRPVEAEVVGPPTKPAQGAQASEKEAVRPAASGSGETDGLEADGSSLKASGQTEPLKKVAGTIAKGQTVSELLEDYLSQGEIYALSRRCGDIYPLRRIKAGHDYRLYLDDSRLKRLEYDIDSERKLCVRFDSGQIEVSTEAIQYRLEQKVIAGRIDSSLFKAVSATGESEKLAFALAEIFAWDVDFIRDIRSGDSFRLLVEKRYRFGEFQGYGDILAAQFTNQGQQHQAFLFACGDGRAEYFTAQGEAVRKTFLKAPLNFTRISSGYTWRRKHPILDVVRPHLGIDYAAPRGTPIKSVADGEVLAKSYSRQAGHYVKIRHHNGYMTIYNHMSRFARGLRRGQEIAQGEVIGYVGTTGLSTGPHLDYRVKRFGKYVNPLKIKSEPVKPVPESLRGEFKKRVRSLVAALDKSAPMYALAEKPAKDTAVH